MKKMFLLFLIIFQSYSFNFLGERAMKFIKKKIHFPSILASNVSQALSIFAAGSALSLMTDRPYKTMFLLSALYFLNLKRNKELKEKIEKNNEEKLKSISEQNSLLEEDLKKEKSNFDLKINQMEERNQSLVAELHLKDQRDISSQKEIEENLKHDDAIIRSLRWQNINLLKELHEAYEKYPKKIDIGRSQPFKKTLFNALVSPLFFYKKKGKKIN
jgi:hypothetical protein